MNDFTWSSSTCSVPDRLRSTSYARLQQCRSAHPLVVSALSPEDAARLADQWMANLKHAIETGFYPGGPLPPTQCDRGTKLPPNPIPQPAPEMRDFYYRDPRQKEADFWQDLKLGLLITLALLGAVAAAAYLLLR